MKEKIGIVGVGYVGGAVQHWFEKLYRRPVKLFLYDRYKEIGSFQEVSDHAQTVFVCVPTPYRERGGGYDGSAIDETLRSLKKPKVVVIKSTVLPGSTERFQKKFPRHKILFNPEFLVAKTANDDFVNPHRQIVGYTRKSQLAADQVLKLLPRAPFTRVMPATEAETVKYFGNAFLALKVIFANQMYDLCERLGIDYDLVREAAGADPRIGQSHMEIFHDGYRGYGGACLPKDTKALIDLAKKLKAPLKLLEMADAVNGVLRRSK